LSYQINIAVFPMNNFTFTQSQSLSSLRKCLISMSLLIVFISVSRPVQAQAEQLRSITLSTGVIISIIDIPCITNPSQLPFPITVFPNPAASSGALSARSSEIISQAVLLDEANFVIARMTQEPSAQVSMQLPEVESGLYRLVLVAKNQAFAFMVLVN
jgi:hypothetical protein